MIQACRPRLTNADIAYYSIPYDATESRSDQWIVTHLPGRRAISFRPDGDKATKAFFMWITPQSEGYEKLAYDDQIAAVRKHLLKGTDLYSPIVERAVRGLSGTPDLYLEYTGQIKAKHLGTQGGRIGLIGDAGYCGTALSGAGTTLSLVGAYVLAGELAIHADDPRTAVRRYEEFMKPFAADKQNLLPGLPHIALPETTTGIAIFHGIVRLVTFLARLRVGQWLFGKMYVDDKVKFPLPDYSKYVVDE